MALPNYEKKVNKSGDTMTGGLNMQGNPIGFGTDGNIYWKEDGFGDKLRILTNFSGGGRDNVLKIQSTTGGVGEDPQNWKDLVTIHADTGEIDLIGRTALQVTSYLAEGTVRAFKIGNIVIVEIHGSMRGQMPDVWTDYPIAKLNVQAGERATSTIVDQSTGLCADATIGWDSDTIYINKRGNSSIDGEWLRGQLIFIVN
ncbi:MAG: hypothetical protein IJK18_08400 [Clostridia bacterium]|nr:hypothetical protein [Clostridia bacterium]